MSQIISTFFFLLCLIAIVLLLVGAIRHENRPAGFKKCKCNGKHKCRKPNEFGLPFSEEPKKNVSTWHVHNFE